MGSFKENSSAKELKVTWCGSQRSPRSLPVPFKSQRGKKREQCLSIRIKESVQSFSSDLGMDFSECCGSTVAPIRAQMKFHNAEDENSTQHSNLGSPLCARAFPFASMFHFHFWSLHQKRKTTNIVTIKFLQTQNSKITFWMERNIPFWAVSY